MTALTANPEWSGNMAATDVAFAASTPAATPGNPGSCGAGVIHSTNPGCAGYRSDSSCPTLPALNRVGGFLGAGA